MFTFNPSLDNFEIRSQNCCCVC